MKPDLAPAGAALLLVLGLTACDSGAGSGQDTAGGEVLEGSVSDAMLPLDAVRSQPPLVMDTSDAAGTDGKQSDAAAGAQDPSDPAAPSDAASAAAASAAPSPAAETEVARPAAE